MIDDNVKILAFYLPQFHPTEENDLWWGRGFTDWDNVVKTKPRFKGHYQPHLPSDLGFYDLRLNEVRVNQALIAKKYGIYGFCYYHYWFNGKLLLERPFNEVLESKDPQFPFCLCWANENWTRSWDGLDHQLLIKQEYNNVEMYKHINWLIKAFTDDRYIKINNKPLFVIYRVDTIPNIRGFIDSWQKVARNNGFNGIYFCAVKSTYVDIPDEEIINFGFDGIIDFQPNRNDFPKSDNFTSSIYQMSKNILPDGLYQKLKLSVTANKVINYKTMTEYLLRKEWPISYCKFPCIFPSWDNSARRRSAVIIQNNDAEQYSKWLNKSFANVSKYRKLERFIFVNAWNEWAEGCHLEPDKKNGYLFLEATLNSLKKLVHS